MNCPYCGQDHGEDAIKTPTTKRGISEDMREHICTTCGLRWTSVAAIKDVFVYNPNTMRDEPVPFDLYKKKYIENRPDKHNPQLFEEGG